MTRLRLLSNLHRLSSFSTWSTLEPQIIAGASSTSCSRLFHNCLQQSTWDIPSSASCRQSSWGLSEQVRPFCSAIDTSSTSTSTSTSREAPPAKQGKGQEIKGGSAAAAGPSSQDTTDPSTLSQNSYRPSRYRAYYQQILYREMLLKTCPKEWDVMPKIKSITLSISARHDTRLEQDAVPKADLLLYSLALEHVAGQPASFISPPNKVAGDKAAGVSVTLTGNRMLDFLEKLVYVVLPNQIGFEGALPPKEVLPVRPPKPDSDILRRPKPPVHSVEFKVSNLLLYPDFEANFDLFEPLRSMQVRIDVERAHSPELVRLLLSGFSLPILDQAALEAQAQQAQLGGQQAEQRGKASKKG